MSKSSQRKLSTYQQGFDDGLLALGFRWSRHPYMEHYARGYAVGEHSRPRFKQPADMNFFERIIFVLFARRRNR